MIVASDSAWVTLHVLPARCSGLRLFPTTQLSLGQTRARLRRWGRSCAVRQVWKAVCTTVVSGNRLVSLSCLHAPAFLYILQLLPDEPNELVKRGLDHCPPLL